MGVAMILNVFGLLALSIHPHRRATAVSAVRGAGVWPRVHCSQKGQEGQGETPIIGQAAPGSQELLQRHGE